MSNVLITGCSRGFGHLAALDLARRGERVFATLRTPEKDGGLAATAAAESLPLTVHRLDVTDTASVRAAVAEIHDLSGMVDVLVNNAGYALRGPLDVLSDEEIGRQLDTNVTGVLRMVREVAPLMRKQGHGRIVNISSSSGLTPIPYEGAYSASKHAVEALSQALAFELAPDGIQVRIIEPGAYETGFVDNSAVAAAFDAHHPLWDEYHRFWEAAAGFTGGTRSEPQAVVEAIRRAVQDIDAPFRQVVGEDAEAIVGLGQQLGLDDSTDTIVATLGLRGGAPE